ncbi:MAG: M16 family metallopeptidase [Gemmatimonadales bacterium]
MRVPFLAGLGGLALAATGRLVGQAGRIPFDTFSLANGLRVIASEDHSTPIVAVDVWYNVGSRNERPGRSGFAHLFEHMMFQGSANVKKAEHFQRIQRAGGYMNGTTREDRTNYYEVVPSNRLNLALWLEADRMRSLAITQENFENQRETVKEERRLSVDNQPYTRAFIDGITIPFDSAACFAYGHSLIGDMADLNAAQLGDVQAFFDTYYAPNNATLVVVGDFTPAELRRLVTQYFGGIPGHPAPAPVACQSPLSPGMVRRDFPDEHANLPAVMRLYRVPPHHDPDTPALELMNIILGQGESSRMHVAIVRREKAALAVQVALNPLSPRRGPGVWFALAIANQGVEASRLDTLLAAQIDTVRASGVNPDELTKAKNTFRASLVENRETAFGKAEELQHYAYFHANVADINTDLDRYLAVTSEDIRRVATKYLDPANAVILLVKPTVATQSGGAP